MAARRKNVLILLNARIASRNPAWCFSSQTPTRHVEQAESLLAFRESVAALDSASPPLTEVPAGTKLKQLIPVFHRPASKPEVVGLGCDPASARSNQHLPVIGDVYLCIRAI